MALCLNMIILHQQYNHIEAAPCRTVIGLSIVARIFLISFFC
jgi:hypothetical protein